MTYNPDIHHRRSIRLKAYDYTQEGAYFITICTKQKQCIFGDVKNGTMHLSHLGAIAYNCWQEIPQHFPHIRLDVFIVMPNHLHGILIMAEHPLRAEHCSAPTQTQCPKFGRVIRGSISSVIRAYKATVTRRINKLCGHKGISLVWQRDFYEHIQRHEASLENTRKYILNNPLQWEQYRENNQNYPEKSEILLDLPF